MSGCIANGATVTTRAGTFLVVGCPCSEVHENGNATGPLALLECSADVAPRHVPGRRTWQPGEQLRMAA